MITISEGLINNSKYEESIMEQASRPRRIFENNIMVPYDIIPSMGFDIIKRYKIKPIKHESIIYFEEIKIPDKK